ncbi:MAG: hypothetical protein SCH98_16240 [Deferrisomatales bacterium]|nr:hypothetical protein [Deferrisomatales bacterium]
MSRWFGWQWSAAPVLPGLALVLGLGLSLGGCGSDDWSDDDGSPRPPPRGSLTVELAGDPSVAYDPARGRTTVVVQFIARGADGVPLAPSDLAVEMLVDGRAVDNESVLQESSQELAASVLYSLVLDASGSMLQHEPPAFGPMKEAARKSVQDGRDLWQDRPGTFAWDVCWFNDVLFHRQGTWNPDHISSIPAPPDEEAATKLYAAVQFMAREMADAHGAGTAAGVRDQHILVVLSDGADNLSGFDNSMSAVDERARVPPSTDTTSTSAGYVRFGWPATTLDDALTAIRAHPRLTVHVLALGSEFRPGDLNNLGEIAQAGGGQLLVNPSSDSSEQLFDRVTREFTTLQTRGAAIPQQSGDHTFTLRVQGVTFTGEGTETFRYRAGPEAQLLP